MNSWKKVEELLEGDILAEDIEDGNRVLLKKGDVLDKQKIEFLHKIGIEWVCIEVDGVLDLDLEILEDKGIEVLISKEIVKQVESKIKELEENIVESESFDLENAREISEIILDTIVSNYKDDVFLNLIKLKNYDEYTFTHLFNVNILSTLISIELKLEKESIKKISLSSLLHDIGKLKMPLNILNAPRTLTKREFELIKMHPVVGKEIAVRSGVSDTNILSGIIHHHERLNGTGYPEGLMGDNISLFARIIAVADVYDALTSERSYKRAWNPYKAMSTLLQSVNAYDGKALNALIRVFGIYPPGTKLLLSNGKKGVVIGTKKGRIFRPTVLCDDGEIIDLSDRKDVKVTKVG